MLFNSAYAGTVIQLPQASSVAAKVDLVADIVFWTSVFFFVLIMGAALLFAWKYHKSKKGRTTAYIVGNHLLEFLWTVVPLVFMVFIFAWGAIVYLDVRRVPQDAYEINVVGRQWLWNIEYPNGRKTMNELYLPKGRFIKLIMTSEDVIHSFYIPNFRTKQDVVPGTYQYLAFEPTMVGVHEIFCAEFCGTGHSDMLGKAYVLEPADFEEWLNTGKLTPAAKAVVESTPQGPLAVAGPHWGPLGSAFDPSGVNKSGGSSAGKTMAEKGKDVFQAKGCFACHTTDGTAKVGPSFKGIYGHDVEISDGRKVMVDENYIRESILEPQAKIVKGFPPSMPTFKGLVTEDEINSLIAFIKSLK